MNAPHEAPAPTAPAPFGLDVATARQLRAVFVRHPGLSAVWVYGSRARGDHRLGSDIDLVADAPEWDDADFSRLWADVDDQRFLHGVDLSHWQRASDGAFRDAVLRERRVFWERAKPSVAQACAGIELKRFQEDALAQLGRYIDVLKPHAAQALAAQQVLRVLEGMEELAREAGDFPKKAWAQLKAEGALPAAFAPLPHSSRFDGAGRAVPNVCLKVPTGGGKTLLAAAAVGQVFGSYLRRHTGLVLWVVPNEAIYRQTLKALSNRDHPYRQLLNVAGAGRVKVLEKGSPLSRLDTDSHLCVMLLMLQSAARASKETLRFFRDRGNVLGFLPREDDIDAHWALLGEVPNLDAYAPWGASAEQARAQKGSIVKSSLGNVMRLLRPMVVIDEGQHAYTENALRTLDGFNPSFMLELSATPRVAGAGGAGSNILIDVRGTDLDEAEMIKLPIHVDVSPGSDWQSRLGASVGRLDALQREADELRAQTSRYIRPILLVQVERTGAELRDAGFIHAEDAKAHLLQLGFSERQIAIKTSEKNDLLQPENIDLLSPTCEVRAIVTKQALQEGWDCPFAYVLCALAAGRNLAAMTQLVGRVLRQPQTAKTGRVALDACYVLCHDARTADVVRAIKKSLEGEGMGDLALTVTGMPPDASPARTLIATRRDPYAKLRIFLPRVTWVEADGQRRELVYDSDVLAALPWHSVDASSLAREWAPDARGPSAQQLQIDLRILRGEPAVVDVMQGLSEASLDPSRIVRSLLDLAPNAWLVWEWVDAVVARLIGQGFNEAQLTGSVASLIEILRIDIEAQRDGLAQAAFEHLVGTGRIEFCLRADRADYELPMEQVFELTGAAQAIVRNDGRPVSKSLLEPALKAATDNRLEVDFACYLDEKEALVWWHRNVAKSQYGLQGWCRNKVYPDFVFGHVTHDGRSRLVVMETKGLQLQGNDDTRYKQALLNRLAAAYRDERFAAGSLAFEDGPQDLTCDLVFDAAWRGTLEQRYFQAPAT